MGRDIRYLPRSGALVEVTCRTIQSRFLLRPGRQLNDVFVGCVAKARGLFPLSIHAVVVASNHYHLLVSPQDGQQLSSFMRHLNTNLSKEIGRLHDWPGTVFDRRYRAIPVSDETEAQVGRLRYLLSHGAKEGLVYSPADWPGVNSIGALLTGKVLRGSWFNRTRELAARQQGESPAPRAFATAKEVQLEPLPCWKQMSVKKRQERVRELIEEIEQEALRMHAEQGTKPSGARAARRVHPHRRPGQTKRTPAPRFHAWAHKQRRRLEAAYAEFLAVYRAAAQKLQGGGQTVWFPEGCFPPARAFVPMVESSAPG